MSFHSIYTTIYILKTASYSYTSLISISCHIYIHDSYVFIQLAMQRMVLTRNTCELAGENTYHHYLILSLSYNNIIILFAAVY